MTYLILSSAFKDPKFRRSAFSSGSLRVEVHEFAANSDEEAKRKFNEDARNQGRDLYKLVE